MPALALCQGLLVFPDESLICCPGLRVTQLLENVLICTFQKSCKGKSPRSNRDPVVAKGHQKSNHTMISYFKQGQQKKDFVCISVSRTLASFHSSSLAHQYACQWSCDWSCDTSILKGWRWLSWQSAQRRRQDDLDKVDTCCCGGSGLVDTKHTGSGVVS